MIISKDNLKIKHLIKLKQKKYQTEFDEFLVFGEHLIEEANKYNLIKEIYTTNNQKSGNLISKEIMKQISFTESPSERVAVVKKSVLNIKSDKILILEDVQDPNNVGALLRSASAFGFKEVYLSEKSADIYNDKVIRASQGSIFQLKIERLNVIEKIKELKVKGFNIYVTLLNGDESISFDEKAVLVLGNEGSGVSSEVIALADKKITIKTSTVESLNVVVAGSILMYLGGK